MNLYELNTYTCKNIHLQIFVQYLLYKHLYKTLLVLLINKYGSKYIYMPAKKIQYM